MLKKSSFAIDANNLSKRFLTQAGEITLFENLSLQVEAGDSIAIIGQSGAGKSTLLSLLAGLDTPNEGSIFLDGIELSQLSDDKSSAWRAENLSFVFQSFHLLPELTAIENVQLPLEIRGEAKATEQARILLKRVGLEAREDHYPSELSGGEQQRVAIARAFVTRPKILFADEPTGNLDTDTGETIIQQLFRLNETEHTTLVLITHDSQLAARCQQQYRLNKGQLHRIEEATV